MNKSFSDGGAADSFDGVEIKAARGLIPLNLHELWHYRELAFFLFLRDLNSRYRQMAFGPLWMIINPLLNTGLNTVVFGVLAQLPSGGIPYPLFNYAALLPWMFFSSVLYTASNSLVSYKDLMAKVYFPRLLVPLVGVLSSLLDFIISFLIFIGVMYFYGYGLSWHIVWAPVFLLLAAVTGLAVGLWTASWIVHYWDVATVLGYTLRVWMFASPVVYASSVVPEKWQLLYHLNPMTVAIEGFRWSMLGEGRPPDRLLAMGFLITLPLMVAGAFYFRRTERSIVDIA